MYVDLVGCETTLRVAADISSIAVVRLDQLSLPRHFTAPSLKLLQNTCSHKPCQYCLECINGPLRRAQGGSGAKQQKPWGSRPIAVHGPPPGDRLRPTPIRSTCAAVTLVPTDLERMFPPLRRFNNYLAANWQQVPKNSPIWVPGEARRTPPKCERVCGV